MSILGHRISSTPIGVLAALMVLVALLPALSSTPTRNVTLVARDMAFYLEGDPRTPNPTLEARAGERLRIVLRNADRGMTHDFAVPLLHAAMDAITWDQSNTVVIDVPSRPGIYEYVCRPHGVMMRGTIRVY
jgi:plastocyanin